MNFIYPDSIKIQTSIKKYIKVKPMTNKTYNLISNQTNNTKSTQLEEYTRYIYIYDFIHDFFN